MGLDKVRVQSTATNRRLQLLPNCERNFAVRSSRPVSLDTCRPFTMKQLKYLRRMQPQARRSKPVSKDEREQCWISLVAAYSWLALVPATRQWILSVARKP